MSKHRTERLFVWNFDDAVKKVFAFLRESDGTTEDKTKAFLCRGWQIEGLGASAVLRATENLIKSTICDNPDMRKHFGRILHVDCSTWKNRRTMQRAIAEELNLHHVMHIFDKQDEDDDFRGLDDRSRDDISSIGSLIHESLRNERFLMFLHYGGVEDNDLVECGIPTFGKGKILWTNSGRFLQVNWTDINLMPTSANMYISFDSPPLPIGKLAVQSILHEEAIGVIGDTGMDGINLETILDCFLYSLILTTQLPENSTGVDYGWATHACNYWICDGILGEEKAWEIGNVLYGVIPCLGNPTEKTRYLASYVDGQKKPYKGWYSITSNKQRGDDISSLPCSVSSYFLTFHGDDPICVPNDLFQLASINLRVLKLYNCSFDFASPPFQCCHNLRFLWLDHCTNKGNEQSGGPNFPNLVVFDLRFTYYVMLPQMIELMTNLRELNTKGVTWKNMSHVLKKLQKLHKLRVTESSDVVTVDSCSSIDMINLELLDLSGNTHMESLPTLSSARSLKMLVLDGCSSLENVVLEGAPPLLESFSFDGYGPAENWIHTIHLPPKELRLKSPIAPDEIIKVTKISLDGCDRLHNIFLRGLPNLEELDLSGTAIKTLDLAAMGVPRLKKLFLMGCQQLRSLLWGGVTELEVVHVDTQGKNRSTVSCGGQRSFGFHAFIAFTDGRLTWSFTKGLNYRTSRCLSKVYMLISCMGHSQVNITEGIMEIGSSQEVTEGIMEIGSSQEGLVPTSPLFPYNNIGLGVTCSSLVWNHQQLQTLDVHIEIGEGSYNLESMFTSCVRHVQSLHVHDNSSITDIPPTAGEWGILEWCHVERCPKLHTMFSRRNSRSCFERIRIISATDLLVAYCIWCTGMNIQPYWDFCFQQLQHIHLYNCPRLVFVLPISFTLPNLETLQIAYCSSLRYVFLLDDKYPKKIASGVTFKNLKHIKLYHLDILKQICETRLTAPALQTIGLRGCSALRRLPAVARQGPKPVVDCEKDWWNSLEWDGLDAGHDPSLFETRHSAYYKKTLPRVSVLR